MTTSDADFRPIDLASAWAAPPPPLDFALPGLALGTVGNVVATGGTGKSFVVLATALGIAIGRDVGQIWGREPKRGPAVYVSIEDPEQVLRERLWAMRRLLDPTGSESAIGQLHVLSCAGQGRALASLDGARLSTTPWFGALRDWVIGVRPRLLVLDTLNRLLGGASENDASVVGWVLAQLEGLARDAGCAVLLCHHVSKGAAAGAGAEDAHAARGSSVLTDNARWQANLSTPLARSRDAGILEADRRGVVRLEVTKSSYASPPPERWLRRGTDGVLVGCAPPAHLLLEELVKPVATRKVARTRLAPTIAPKPTRSRRTKEA